MHRIRGRAVGDCDQGVLDCLMPSERCAETSAGTDREETACQHGVDIAQRPYFVRRRAPSQRKRIRCKRAFRVTAYRDCEMHILLLPRIAKIAHDLIWCYNTVFGLVLLNFGDLKILFGIYHQRPPI